ncbi:nucleotidyltransferase domain-containing protein [Candidatus Albibeggiatoa sp. nov. NOAA]|uniref:nucleotidyltransferase domain-containing protein n=1 Tax=Candidatus Albibeggiatoa sp. nov. NOAA TaxID=3162724 RepID=UPI0032FCBC9E|nr:nucleotidyltransferase domain-containing protein [Thiotrichaceae bacterium]
MTQLINDEIRQDIMQRLHRVEKDHDVRILLAIESGSRAWGFASPNSDYDVRFIYVHNKDWYVAVDFEEKRDVIEYPIVDEIDLNGWDVRKALRLFWKSNPTFVEWIQSPIIYMESGLFKQQTLAFLPHLYSVEKGIYHYLSMAKTTYHSYLRAEYILLKKYFYALRPLLAIRWLEKYQTAAPIEFYKLLELVEDRQILDVIYELLEKKQNSEELALAPALPELTQFIESELIRFESMTPIKMERDANMAQLNQLFHTILNEQA